ncbi:MAG TPA: ribosome small subunit-dependent GTPase A [Chloroflexota bacterium]|nr:ribosome small subunit-dependent GTPase A [Chloroflexota bacterium]
MLRHSVEGDVPERRQGLVVRKSQGHYVVDRGTDTILCAISNKLRKQLVFPTAAPTSVRRRVVAVEDIRAIDPIAIGDRVAYIEGEGGTGQILEVLPRVNKLARRAAGRKPIEQVIVANVDQVVLVFSAAQPALQWTLLDRYLATVELHELTPTICITKTDLVDRAELEAELADYRRIGYPVVLTSAVTGDGIPEFRSLLRDRVSVLVGKSGVGKSSLLNALEPGLGLRVGEISKWSGKGRHTTRHLEMFRLRDGGAVIDTPGMREFAIWDISEVDLGHLFPEMRPFLGQCRFGASCAHDREPGCAIKAAVEQGAISERRYFSFLRLNEWEEE